jgi:DNA-binding CsgD family transcriptional regulator
MYCLGCAFAYKQGFFRTQLKTKCIVCGLILIASIVTQCRFGVAHLVETLLECLLLFILISIIAVLFWQEVGHLRQKNKETVLWLSPVQFTARDVEILRRILSAEKYDAIAAGVDMSLSALKQHVKTLFNKINVADKAAFMSRYARYTIELEEKTTEEAEDIEAHAGDGDKD